MFNITGDLLKIRATPAIIIKFNCQNKIEMKKLIYIPALLLILCSCEERTEKAENSRGIPGPEKVKALAPDIDEQEDSLNRQGYQTARYQDGDTTYLRQKYFMAFLKKAGNLPRQAMEDDEIKQQQDFYLKRMVKEGYVSLAGPLEEEDEINQVIIFNTPTRKKADSLARLHPLVESGDFNIEVYPWWATKGAKLD